MKVLMISDFFGENLDYQENFIGETLVKQGHEVVIVTSTFSSVFDYYADKYDETAPSRTYVAKGMKIVRLQYRYNFLQKVRRYPAIDGILDSEQPDLIFAHDITLNFPECIRYMKRYPKCRMIMDYHADSSNSGKNWPSRAILHGVIRKHFLNRARPYLSKIFPVVPGSADFLRQYYGVRDDEMELLPLAVDMTMARRARQERQGAALRAQLGIPEGAIVVFTGGKFHALKRTELAIEATARLSRLSVHLIIVGEGDKGQPDYAQWLMELARATPNVHLLGWQDRAGVFRAMNAADLAVFPASQSVLWQQAIGMGLPLVVGDLGGQDPSYLNTQDSLVILRGYEISASRIGHEIERIGNNRNVRAAMSAGALRFADDYLDWDKLVRRVLRFNTALG